MSNDLVRVIGGPQNYAWGKLGSNSSVARFAHASDPQNVIIDESLPYAEYWMGTHPKVPTILSTNGEKLSDLISSNPEKYLSKSIMEKFNLKNSLPFLFKVLSIEKVLSIQSHPDKKLAEQLRLKDPEHYPDDNHKPEMAIAITDFEAFCGFKPLETIKDHLLNIKEFSSLIGDETTQIFINNPSKENLKLVFSKVMNSNDDDLIKYSNSLVLKAKENPSLYGETLSDLILRLNDQFPNDIGLFCGCLMLNHCILKTGEAMFLQACEPHAYISGDIIECMAASDNVIRSGFTPKFKDVETLINSLTYSTNNVDEQKLNPANFERGNGDAIFNLYDPPIDEFSVLQVKFDKKGKANCKGINGPSIIIVTEGNGIISNNDENKLDVFTGAVFFVAPNVELNIETNESLVLYRAYCEA